MKRIIRLLFPLLVLPAFAQVPVSPIVQPHVTFVNEDGSPCANCSFASFAAGTTTPLATYIDASGTSQNTNPIILDAAGGANIWLANNSYKFILKDTSGTTIWSVDQVKGGWGAGGICGPSGAIQIANSAINGLTCDPNITINLTSHTINIGILGPHYVAIGPRGTATSWWFDTTSPATALASLGAGIIAAGTANQLAYYPSDGNNIQGTSVIPAGITATTQAINDKSQKLATTNYVSAPGNINPTSLSVNGGTTITDNQGNGVKIQHSTGSITTDNCVKFDAGGNTTDAGLPCNVPVAGSFMDVSGSRSAGATYQNTNATMMYVSGAFSEVGSGTGQIICSVGVASASAKEWEMSFTSTADDFPAGFSCMVPASYYYSISVSGNVSSTIREWTELPF